MFTGKLPRGLADFPIRMLRYTARAELYAGFLYTDYPPFEFTMSASDPGENPAHVAVRPVLEDRNRLTVGFRVSLRLNAYALLLTDEYPPFATD